MRTLVFFLGCVLCLLFAGSKAEAQCCDYVVGDINGNGTTNGIDVVYAINYFKGGPVPPIDCGTPTGQCPQPNSFFAAGDVNGDCRFNGIDILWWIRGFPHRYCPSCPPCQEAESQREKR